MANKSHLVFETAVSTSCISYWWI